MERRRRRSGTLRKNSSKAENFNDENSKLDSLCASLVEGSSSWVNDSENQQQLNFVSPDPTPTFECFATQIRSCDAKQKLIRDLQVHCFFFFLFFYFILLFGNYFRHFYSSEIIFGN